MAKNILLCCTLLIPLLALNACSQQSIPNSGSANTSNNTQSNNAAPGSDANGQGFASSPIVAPPSYDQRPLKPGESPPPQTLPNGLPALKPLKGVHVDKLFAENLTDTNRRFERVENAVVDMRKEFEAIKPAIVRLVAVEEDIQNMVEQLEAIASQEQFAAPPAMQPAPIESVQTVQPSQPSGAPQNLTPADRAPAPAEYVPPEPPAQPQAAPQAPQPPPQPTASANTSEAIVKNLRTGVHDGKKRLVLDMSKKTPFTVDLDTSENILVIELPQAGWSGETNKNFGTKEPLIASYSVTSINNGQGTRIIIPLKKVTSIAKQAVLPPGTNPNFRMYVDMNL